MNYKNIEPELHELKLQYTVCDKKHKYNKKPCCFPVKIAPIKMQLVKKGEMARYNVMIENKYLSKMTCRVSSGDKHKLIFCLMEKNITEMWLPCGEITIEFLDLEHRNNGSNTTAAIMPHVTIWCDATY